MGNVLMSPGGGLVTSDDLTAKAQDVLSGKTFMGATNDEIAVGMIGNCRIITDYGGDPSGSIRMTPDRFAEITAGYNSATRYIKTDMPIASGYTEISADGVIAGYQGWTQNKGRVTGTVGTKKTKVFEKYNNTSNQIAIDISGQPNPALYALLARKGGGGWSYTVDRGLMGRAYVSETMDNILMLVFSAVNPHISLSEYTSQYYVVDAVLYKL